MAVQPSSKIWERRPVPEVIRGPVFAIGSKGVKMTPQMINLGVIFTPETGGGSGIRTHDEVAPIAVFKLVAVRTNRFFSPVNPANRAELY